MSVPSAHFNITAKNQTQRAFDEAQKNMKGMTVAALSASRVFAGLSVALSAKQIISFADRAQTIENRLKLVTASSEELLGVQERLYRVAQDTRSSYEGTVELYSRIARSADQLGISEERLLNVTQSIQQAIIASGATATEASAGMIQLAQGLASGALRGDELRSVLEQMPRLARAIADGMGITIGQLREVGTEGQLTAETVIMAIESQATAIQTEFESMDWTIGQAVTGLGNSMLRFIGRLDDAAGASQFLSRTLRGLSTTIDALSGADPFPFEQQITDTEAAISRLRIKSGFQELGDLVQAQIDGMDKIIHAPWAPALQVDELVAEWTKAQAALQKYRDLQDKALGVNLAGRFSSLQAVTAPHFDLIDDKDLRAEIKKAEDARDRRVQSILRSLETDNERVLREFAEIQDLRAQGFLDDDTVQRFIASVLQPIEVTAKKMTDTVEEKTDEISVFADEAARSMQSAFADFLFDPFENGIEGMVQSFATAIRRMVAEAAAAKLMEKIFGKGGGEGDTKTGLGALLAGFLPGFADGGTLTPGVPSIVGERGPEIIMPRTPGVVIPNNMLGGATVVQHITNRFDVGLESVDQRIAAATPDIAAAAKIGVLRGLKRPSMA